MCDIQRLAPHLTENSLGKPTAVAVKNKAKNTNANATEKLVFFKCANATTTSSTKYKVFKRVSTFVFHCAFCTLS